jgi:hypothetical protein
MSRYDAGLCIDCGSRPHLPDRTRCAACGALNLERSKARYRARNPGARTRALRCGICHGPGHDRRRCDRALSFEP